MSSLNSIKKLLQQIKPEITKKYHVKSIGLFGSIVRDDFSLTKSDVDIIVDFSKLQARCENQLPLPNGLDKIYWHSCAIR